MLHPTSPQIEKLFLSTFGRGLRVACITSIARRAGVSGIAECLANRAALAGQHTLLFNLSEGAVPSATNGVEAGPQTSFEAGVADGPLLFDRMTLQIPKELLAHYRNRSAIRAIIDDQSNLYDFIVVDAGPCNYLSHRAVPGPIAASACDGVVIVTRGDSTTREELDRALGELTENGAVIVGLVVINFKRKNPLVEALRKNKWLNKMLRKLLGVTAKFMKTRIVD